MKKYEILLSAIVVVLSTTVLTSLDSVQSQPQVNILDNSVRKDPKALVDLVWRIVNDSYVDDTTNKVNWRSVRKQYLDRSYSDRKQAYQAIKQMLGKLDDPYTYFMEPEEAKGTQVEDEMLLRSREIGKIGITFEQDKKTKQLKVLSPIKNTPAFAAGILAEDIIVKIDGKSTAGMDVKQASSLIRGSVGTSVNITIQRNGKQKDFQLERVKINIPSVRYTYQNSSIGGVGYIRLNEFASSIPGMIDGVKEMEDAIKELESKRVAGYILDLRNNPGGNTIHSVNIAKMWLEDGTIVSIKDRKREQRIHRANHTAVKEYYRQREQVIFRENDRALTNKPLVVLVNYESASASEILSGALQDNKRAVLVGERTRGKGSVQEFFYFADGSGLALTTDRVFIPSGRDINRVGIAPDVEVPLTYKQKKALFSQNPDKVGTLADPQYARALQVLEQQVAANRHPTRDRFHDRN